MLHFRTILLFLAFILLVIQGFVYFDNLRLGIFFRLIPTALLLVWFVSSIFGPKKYTIQLNHSNRKLVSAIKILRPLASLTIIIGAILKILHVSYGNYFLTAGIGLLAFWSLLFSLVAISKDEYNPEIIDDIDPEED